MKERYLEVTFRGGKPLAAYLRLPRSAGARAARTVQASPGLLVDYSADDVPIGLEITAPGVVPIEEIDRVLRSLGLEEAGADELAPLKAA